MIAEELLEALLEFRRERTWEEFHTRRNLSAALSVEAAELLDEFRWARDSEIAGVVDRQRSSIESELANVAIILTYLTHDLHVSLDEAVRKKLHENRRKYPIEKANGNSLKHNQLR